VQLHKQLSKPTHLCHIVGHDAVEGALEVLKDVLRGCEMGLMRVVYVEAHLLDHVSNVGPGESEVLESPSQVAVGSRVADGGSMSEETLA
jgi:hypothetical protein